MTKPDQLPVQQGKQSLWTLQKYALDKHAIVAITDLQGRITYVNDLFCDISGYRREEILGNTHRLINSGFHPKEFFTEMFRAIHDEGQWRGEICNRRKNGELYWVESTISQLMDDQGNPDGYIALRTDVTDQHRTLEAMRRLHEITSARETNVNQKAQQILELGCEIFNLPIGIISHITSDTYTVRYCVAPGDGLSPGDTFELGNTYCSQTLACHAPVAYHHVAESDFNGHPAYKSFGLEAYIGAQLLVNDVPFGTINFSGPDFRERPFSSGEIELIQLFSKWIGDAFARHETDTELDRQRALLDSVSEQARIGAWELDLSTNELHWSRMTRVIHEVDDDYQPDVATAINFYQDGPARDTIRAAVEEAVSFGKSWELELPLVTAKGNPIWVHARGEAVMAGGVCIRLFGSFQDITQQRKAKAQQIEQAQRHQLMVESTAVGFWDWDIETDAVTYSERWADIIGYDLSELEPANVKTWRSACHPDDLKRSDEALQKHWNRETDLYACEARMKHKDGHWVWVHDTGRVVEWTADGKPKRMIGTHLDISQQKESEEAILQAKREAESAARAKSEFLATMSHEIRTPMNGVLGMLNLLQNTPLSEDQVNRIRIAQNSAQSLLALINDILDFSKIEANKLELEHIDFDINQTLTECIESLASQAEVKGLELIVDTSLLYSPFVNGDPGRIRQILTNLISNAVKFTTSGHIVVTLTQVRQKNHWLTKLIVEDSGIGIPPEKQEHLFKAFNQLDSSTTRQFGGSGLGLAIVRNLCELMDGDIEVESKAGIGSRFTATVSLGQATDQHEVVRESLKGKKILLIEDHPKGREVLANHFSESGAQVTTAMDGQEAAQKSATSTESFDIVLLDYDIPGDDWRRTAAKLSTIPSCETALRLLTVPVTYQKNYRVVESGDLHGHIQKPLNILNLQSFLGKRNQSPIDIMDSTQNARMPTFSGKRVLLVEDNHVNQLVAEEMLTAFGIQVDVAEHGKQALDILESQKAPPYDLILMDCQMPVMDGYEATRRLRHGQAGDICQSLPVIAMTAHAMTGDKERCLASGMNDYLPKPVDPSQLLTLLERWLGNATMEAERPAGDLAQAHRPPQITEVWDRAQALNRVVGNQSLLNQLINMFRSEQPVRLQEMRDAYKAGDYSTLTNIAHSLKGVAGNLGIRHVQSISAELESDLRSGNTSDIEATLTRLEEETERFVTLFKDQEPPAKRGNPHTLRANLLSIRSNLAQNDYISQKSLEFLNYSYNDAVIEEELSKLAREITAFENAQAQTRLNRLLEEMKEPK